MGFAILWIMFFHTEAAFQNPLLNAVRTMGYAGFDIFFFASGAGVYFSLQKNDDAISFYKRRIKRVMPTYLSFIGFWFLFRFAIGEMTFPMAIGNVLAVQTFFGLDGTFNWYITYLLLFYLLSPALWKLFFALKKDWLCLLSIAAVFLLLFIFCHIPQFTIGLSRLPIFMLGMLLAKHANEVGQEQKIPTGFLIFSLLLIPVGLSLAYYFGQDFLRGWNTGLSWYPLILAVPGICVLLSFLGNALDGFLKHKPLSFMGTWSLELYLVHIFVFEVYNKLLIQRLNLSPRLWYFLLVLLASMLSAFLLRQLTKVVSRNVLAITFLAAFVIISSLPLFLYGIEGRTGQDLGFHLMRIEALFTELKNGVFPVKMESLWMDGYGYPAPIYYGDLLLYLPALLRLLSIDVTTSYKIYVFFINALTAGISYVSFRLIFKNNKSRFIPLLCTAAYLFSVYRLTNVYVRAAVGEYSAMAFLPLVAAAVVCLYRAEKLSRTQMVKIATALAVALTGILETHILSVEMTALFLVLVALLRFRKTFTKQTILTCLLAGCETVLFNLFFLVPFLDYYKNETVNINIRLYDTHLIQYLGITATRYLAFFHTPFQPDDASDRIGVTPGILLLFTFAAATVFLMLQLVRKKPLNHTFVIFFVLSLVSLFLGSAYFPWDFLTLHTSVGKFLSAVQFPWRYMSFATLFLSLLLGSLLSEILTRKTSWRRALCSLCLLLSLLNIGVFFYYYSAESVRVCPLETADLNTYDMGWLEYLRAGTERDAFTFTPASENATVEILSRRGTEIVFSVRPNSTQTADNIVELPVLNYKGYIATTAQGEPLQISDGSNNVIRVTVPYRKLSESTIVTVRFQQPWYWVLAEFLSLVAVISAFTLLMLLCYTNSYEKKRSIR